MSKADLEAKIIENYRKLDPEERKFVLKVTSFMNNAPGFTAAYMALPIAHGREAPSWGDVAALIDEYEGLVHHDKE